MEDIKAMRHQKTNDRHKKPTGTALKKLRLNGDKIIINEIKKK